MEERIIKLSDDQKRELEELWTQREMIKYRSLVWTFVNNVHPLIEGAHVITSSSLTDNGELKVMIEESKDIPVAQTKDKIETELKN